VKTDGTYEGARWLGGIKVYDKERMVGNADMHLRTMAEWNVQTESRVGKKIVGR
jgi:hypothetical protein